MQQAIQISAYSELSLIMNEQLECGDYAGAAQTLNDAYFYRNIGRLNSDELEQLRMLKDYRS